MDPSLDGIVFSGSGHGYLLQRMMVFSGAPKIEQPDSGHFEFDSSPHAEGAVMAHALRGLRNAWSRASSAASSRLNTASRGARPLT